MNRILLFSVLCILSLSTFSQTKTWIDKGAKWKFNYGDQSGDGYEEIDYEKDTLINGKACQKLKSSLQKYYYYLGKAYPHPIWYFSNFTYKNGDTILYYNSAKSNFHVLYNFGLKAGDSWRLEADTNSFGCSKSIVHVDSVGVEQIMGKSYRYQLVHSDSTSSEWFKGKISEKFGSVGYLFPKLGGCGSSSMEPVFHYLLCYEDSGFSSYSLSSRPCDYWDHIGIEEHELKKDIQLFPNPVKYFLYVSLKNRMMNGFFTITNCLGEVIKQGILAEKVDVSDLPKGLYIFTYTEEKTYYKKFIKE